MNLEFEGQIWYWRGPAPWYFVTVPPGHAAELNAMSRFVTYGWGMIPAKVRIGEIEWQTSLWPKDDTYIVPIKTRVRVEGNLHEGDTVTVQLEVR